MTQSPTDNECHSLQSLRDSWLDGRLAPQQWERIERHLNTCDQCHRQWHNERDRLESIGDTDLTGDARAFTSAVLDRWAATNDAPANPVAGRITPEPTPATAPTWRVALVAAAAIAFGLTVWMFNQPPAPAPSNPGPVAAADDPLGTLVETTSDTITRQSDALAAGMNQARRYFELAPVMNAVNGQSPSRDFSSPSSQPQTR
ncbi:MAG: hypothetical protein R3336_04140 [Phycisphaeraceae bacterium]|nr:hypothetical protein [Phycisphaeraceae bacterium]